MNNVTRIALSIARDEADMADVLGVLCGDARVQARCRAVFDNLTCRWNDGRYSTAVAENAIGRLVASVKVAGYEPNKIAQRRVVERLTQWFEDGQLTVSAQEKVTEEDDDED